MSLAISLAYHLNVDTFIMVLHKLETEKNARILKVCVSYVMELGAGDKR